MPDAFVEGLKKVEEDGETRYRVSLDYPEIQPFMANAEYGALRKAMFLKNQRKGGADNVGTLEEAIRVRTEIAALLGYDSWAAYAIEVRMAKKRGSGGQLPRGPRTKVRGEGGGDMQMLR